MLRNLRARTLPAVLVGAATLGWAGAAAALEVTPTDDAATLVNTILGDGITVNMGSISYTGTGTNATGTFSDGLSSGIGIDSGIVLTTGNADDAEGPNTGDGYDFLGAATDLGLAGDAELDALLPMGDTSDAIILEFDFTSDSGDLFFNFVFASEEYNEYVNTEFNDVFAFFLDGTNVATLNDGTPVSINTVNGGNPLGTDASNSDLFNNNDLDDGGPFFDLQYDGFTDVLQVRALGIGAGTHTIRLAIADAGDSILDSAVFIEAGTFRHDVIPEPATIGLMLIGLGGLGARKVFRG